MKLSEYPAKYVCILAILAGLTVLNSLPALSEPAKASEGDKWALVIGVSQNKSLGKLPVAAADARAMKSALQQIGYPDNHIKLLTDGENADNVNALPTGGFVRQWTKRVSAVASEDDTILLFFSGHGVTRDGDGYLMPMDASRDSGVAVSWIEQQLAKSKADEKIMIVDACHAGAAKGVNGIVPEAGVETVLKLLSCRSDQVSWPDEDSGHSVFTRYLVEGLTGAATGKGRKITASALAEYVVRRVKEWTFQAGKSIQTPVVRPESAKSMVLGSLPEKPRIKIISVVDGERVRDATVRLNGKKQPQQTPCTVTLQEGSTYEIKVTYDGGSRGLSPSSGGRRRYRPYSTTVRADFTGLREVTATIEEITDPTAGNVLGMEFERIKSGTFQMGSNSDEADDDEQPVHTVRISEPLWMGKYEVTLAEYREFMESSGKEDGIDWDDSDCPYEKRSGYALSGNEFAQDDAQPVVEVSWHGAVAFCEWLTKREREAGRLPEGYEYRLPTEAEWEYCCRAGSDTAYCFGDNESRLSEYANYEDTPKYGDDRTAPVGEFKPNAWGLYDMHGNDWEWCVDWYDSDYYDESPKADPVNTEAASGRVVRGGDWDNSSGGVRSAGRDGGGPGGTSRYLGFRVCLAPPVRE